MTRLTWGDQAEHRFESGIDRGVLYPRVGNGVAWPGLISVNEAPIGGTSTPYYMDGVRHLDRPESEEFSATVEAYTYPREFEVCDGTAELAEGLFAGHQRRQPFGMTYRTQVGTALNNKAGYKIHIVYNAMAEPSQRNFQTLRNDPEATTFSWLVNAIPKRITNAKPTAHLIIDSLVTNPSTLSTLENMLYGSSTSEPSLPTPEQLIELFVNGAPATEFVVTDLGADQFQVSGSDAEVQSTDPETYVITTDLATDNGDDTFTLVSG